MKTHQIEISPDFKKNLQKAILSIGLFVFVYLVLFSIGVLITALSVALGIGIIAASPGIITVLLGLGLIGMGIFILVFLVKFIFKRNVVDRSQLLEITEKDEPQLFALIQEIVDKAQTQFPKKVYLSAAVNAGVFYDSSFWSMFFPIRKNLEIGLGLVNGITHSELKAILAHEFGHFSQRSMKVGSYVYHVNQVIYNLLYENQSYGAWVDRWSSLSFYFSIFMRIGIKVIQAIQWVLQKMYNVVNLSYMGLSRSMEFHADEIAANIAGSAPLMSALARLQFIDFVFNDVLNHYSRKIPDGVKTLNIYPPHKFALKFRAKENKYPLKNELPQIDPNMLNPFDKSRLVIKDQWASHPSTPDRIKALAGLNIQREEEAIQSANHLFKNLDLWQTQITGNMFASINYVTPPQADNFEDFQKEFVKNYQDNSFEPLYNNYYDQHNPNSLSLEDLLEGKVDPMVDEAAQLYNPEAIDMMYSMQALEADLITLQYLQQGQSDIKSFDYAGKKYTAKKTAELILHLQQNLRGAKHNIEEHDLRIFWYFYQLAIQQNQGPDLLLHYRRFIEYDRVFEQHKLMVEELMQHIQFFQEVTPFEQIEANFYSLKPLEIKFKASIETLLEDDIYQLALTEPIREHFKQYLSREWVYFVNPEYQNEALQVLIDSIDDYTAVVQNTYFNLKKTLLGFQVQLENDKK